MPESESFTESEGDRDSDDDFIDDDDQMPPFAPPKVNLMSKLKVIFGSDSQAEKEKALGILHHT